VIAPSWRGRVQGLVTQPGASVSIVRLFSSIDVARESVRKDP
jgi:hypothetical protein